MTFSPKQSAAISKAVDGGYLSHMVDGETRDWLRGVSPKTPEDASMIVEYVLFIAYGLGERIWNPAKRREAQLDRAERLRKLRLEYAQ